MSKSRERSVRWRLVVELGVAFERLDQLGYALGTDWVEAKTVHIKGSSNEELIASGLTFLVQRRGEVAEGMTLSRAVLDA